MTIGEVATQARVNVQTVRYYERRGLLPAARRTSSGYRQYGDDAVGRLRFIRAAQVLGFSLKEIGELLGLRVRSRTACHDVEEKALGKIAEIQAKIVQLERLKNVLERLAAACRRREPTGDCPILDALDDGRLG